LEKHRRALLGVLSSALLIGCSTAPRGRARAESDGRILSAAPCRIRSEYSALSPAARSDFDPAEFEEAKRASPDECIRATYSSGGLRVVGFVYRPARLERGRRYPVIVYNRGGNGDFGVIGDWDQAVFHRFVRSGYVVLASQYRGSDGGEGSDEFGGADVEDVMSLFPLAERLGYADTGSVFMVGVSRGTIDTFLALRRGAPVKAAVVVGAVSDLSELARYRPEFLDIWRRRIPGFASRSDEEMRERSAIYWPEKIDTPLLLLHGGSDRRVPPEQSTRLAEALRRAGGRVEIRIFPGDSHTLPGHGRERDARTVEWFERHAGEPAG
jgi:dipeptidyl aminopeptidase/acylaminoacyl peptidase